jgi:hypothetical protein
MIRGRAKEDKINERTRQVLILAMLSHNGNAYFMDTRLVARFAALNVPQPVAMS